MRLYEDMGDVVDRVQKKHGNLEARSMENIP